MLLKLQHRLSFILNTIQLLSSYSSQMSMTFFGDSHTAVLAFCFFRVSRLQVVLGYLNLNYYNLKPKRTFLLISPHNTRMLIIKDWDFFSIYQEHFLDLIIPIIHGPLVLYPPKQVPQQIKTSRHDVTVSKKLMYFHFNFHQLWGKKPQNNSCSRQSIVPRLCLENLYVYYFLKCK